ncbi:unnamed protein product [Psylliodes chrysocephalus]|uniref:Uncharacterized protein n=1 Tax=Psylliodes chrysocephalus TaxID=3402493 RepID=A0A9P0GKI3_9CUCU|nr:unnamed protein product [Psylliodes chrysocephala]
MLIRWKNKDKDKDKCEKTSNQKQNSSGTSKKKRKFGRDGETDTSKIVDWDKIREISRNSSNLQTKRKQHLNNVRDLYLDGRIDDTLIIEKIVSPKFGSVKDLASIIVSNFTEEEISLEHIDAVSCDVTNTNTG